MEGLGDDHDRRVIEFTAVRRKSLPKLNTDNLWTVKDIA